MIEGPGGAPPSSRATPRGFSFDQLVGHIRGWAEGVGRLVLPQAPHHVDSDVLLWRLRLAERILWFLLAIFALYLIVDLSLLQPKLPALPGRAAAPASVQPSEPAVEPLKPLAEYREALVVRNPFGIASLAGGGSAGGEQVKNRLAELAGSLTVVGINRGKIPEAIIEDTTAKRTVFVKVGDQVNELTVKAIDQNGVVVTYEGKETTLH